MAGFYGTVLLRICFMCHLPAGCIHYDKGPTLANSQSKLIVTLHKAYSNYVQQITSTNFRKASPIGRIYYTENYHRHL